MEKSRSAGGSVGQVRDEVPAASPGINSEDLLPNKTRGTKEMLRQKISHNCDVATEYVVRKTCSAVSKETPQRRIHKELINNPGETKRLADSQRKRGAYGKGLQDASMTQCRFRKEVLAVGWRRRQFYMRGKRGQSVR